MTRSTKARLVCIACFFTISYILIGELRVAASLSAAFSGGIMIGFALSDLDCRSES